MERSARTQTGKGGPVQSTVRHCEEGQNEDSELCPSSKETWGGCCFFGHFSVPWTLDQEAPLSSASVTALTDKNRPVRLECYQINVFALVDRSTRACTFLMSRSPEFPRIKNVTLV
ncbi:hypothetical protein QQF64_004004 [Cirrhinus molitorella]|uniref:Uncharacterized protein n=1 Tax=Cirrhinus molitorella TaxID=172907 RepID=A0ABR3MMX2_9TELE